MINGQCATIAVWGLLWLKEAKEASDSSLDWGAASAFSRSRMNFLIPLERRNNGREPQTLKRQ